MRRVMRIPTRHRSEMSQSHQHEPPAIATGGLSPAVEPPKDKLGNSARLSRTGLGAGEDLAGDAATHDHAEASVGGGDDSGITVQRGGATWTVKKGDVLWNISKATYGSGVYWKKIKEANPTRVFGESTIHRGAVLDLPTLDVAAATAPSTEAGVWTVDNVVAILNQGSGKAALQKIVNDGIKIVRFDTAIQIWEHDDGTLEREDLKTLRGNTSAAERTIRVRTSLSDNQAAITLFHELNHWGRPETSTQEEYLDEEVDVRANTEQFAIDSGLDETRPGYRKEGKVDNQAIKDSVYDSQHYNPTGKHFHSREYVGQITAKGWNAP